MFGSAVLDVIIGLVTLYFLLSIICSALSEFVSLLLSMRATNLINAIEGMLFQGVGERVRGVPTKEAEKGTGISLTQLYNHGLVWSLGRATRPFPSESLGGIRGRGQPAYIPSDTFSRALVDLVARSGAKAAAVEQLPAADSASPMPASTSELLLSFRAGVEKMNDVPLKRVLGLMLAEASNDYTKLRVKIESWYDQTMDRARGWYKGWATLIITCWAIVVCLLANADTVAIVRTLSVDRQTREAVAAVALEIVKEPVVAPQPGEQPRRIAETMDTLSRTGLPLGWQVLPWDWKASRSEWAMKLVGLMLSVAAVSLGAPFWFDLLNKLVNIRLAGKPLGTQSDQGSPPSGGSKPDRNAPAGAVVPVPGG